jgi:hypothetical protein
MGTGEEQARLLDIARQGLQQIGYIGGLLRESYQFTDVLHAESPVREIALAAFAQEPPSYRTASLGVALSSPDEAPHIEDYRALGAPQLLSLHRDEVRRWKMTGSGKSELLQRIPADRLLSVLIDEKDTWGPGPMLRAKSIAFDSSSQQLDFFDAGLLPAIDDVVHEKLDRMLREAIAASSAAFTEHNEGHPDWIGLCRLIFRLLAGKLFADRGELEGWTYDDPAQVIAAVEQFYFRAEPVEPALADPAAQRAAWHHINSAIRFQNLSVEALAHVYENTLVNNETRRRYGTHSTPQAIAKYVVQRLPFDDLPSEERRVFEPFTGHGAFLVPALDRLRMLLPPGTDARARHDYFVRMLTGMELDPFAREVARLALMLADYPNPDGWRLLQGDVFTDDRLEVELKKARIVLCNPPFEAFTAMEREGYQGLLSTEKAADILERVLRNKPAMLGFVLPKVFIDGQSYRSVRRTLVSSFGNLELVSLPDVVFAHSEVETVLLLAYGAPSGYTSLRAASVERGDYDQFERTAEVTSAEQALLPAARMAAMPSLWLYPLSHVWESLAHLPVLDTVAQIHRGIEYKVSPREHADKLVSQDAKSGYRAGLLNVTDGFEPYFVHDHVYLNMASDLMLYRAYQLPWHQPKVIATAARHTRGVWTLSAVPDDTGLVCSQRFHGIWPSAGLPIEILAAILNGPVANAYVGLRRTSRDNRIGTIASIPLPSLSQQAIQEIVGLVREYRVVRQEMTGQSGRARDLLVQRMHRLLLEIDAGVLAAYDLAPRLERDLLRYFAGEQRPGRVPFTGYYPKSFQPALPLRLVISGDLDRATGPRILKRLPVLHDQAVSAMLADLESESAHSEGD